MTIESNNINVISLDLAPLGLTPNEEWLRAFLEHCGDSACSSDEVMEEILYTDLHLVVQGYANDSDQCLPSASSTMLSEAISASRPTSIESDKRSIYKSNLPASFRCVAQIEELLDVSQNAETRLRYGPNNSSDPTPVGNQSSRCLKLLLSDGYRYDPIVATEISPIRNLSAHSNAGIKVLLKGPIEVRCGVLLLHEGNTIVLGGQVDSLVEVQKKAREQARKAACVGQDATIRALVSSTDEGGTEEDEEGEGEEASRDLQPSVQNIHCSTDIFNLEPINQRQIPQQTNNGNVRVHTRSTVSGEQGRIQTYAPPPSSVSSHVSLPNSEKRINPYGSSSLHFPLKSNDQTAHTNRKKNFSTSSNFNPYASSLPASTSVARSTVGELTNNVSNISNALPRTNTSSIPTEQNTIDLSLSLSPIDKSSPPLQNDTLASSGMLASLSPTALTLPLSFSEFLVILDEMRTNSNSYRRYESKVFVIPAKMKGTLKLFNIEKIKKKKDKKTKGEKQYGFTITCSLVGAPESNRRITCKLGSNVLEPYFSLPPGELRQLSKTDKKKSDEITQEGGTKMCNALQKLASMSIKLMLCQEEFYSKGVPRFDDEQAYLLVTDRE